jgi:hypothetical protein
MLKYIILRLDALLIPFELKLWWKKWYSTRKNYLIREYAPFLSFENVEKEKKS